MTPPNHTSRRLLIAIAITLILVTIACGVGVWTGYVQFR